MLSFTCDAGQHGNDLHEDLDRIKAYEVTLRELLGQSPQEASYTLRRLERVRKRLAQDHLHRYLNATQRTQYVHATASYLAEHLLEGYRKRAEELLITAGADTITPQAKRYLSITTSPTGTLTVKLSLPATHAEEVYTALIQVLEASHQDLKWTTMAQRLSVDLSTWALERMHADLGEHVIVTLSDPVFDETVLAYMLTKEPDVCHERVHDFLTRMAQNVAFDLATIFISRNPSLTEFEYLLGFQEAATPAERLKPLLRENHLTTFNAAHYQAIREAIYKKMFQYYEGIPWPTALLEKGTARGQAQLRPVVIDTNPLISPEEVAIWAQRMWKQREALSDLDADALDMLSARWLYQARTPNDDAVADVDDLLAMRGLQTKPGGQGRRGGYTATQRTAMLQALAHIQSLWINMSELEVYENVQTSTGRKRRKTTRQAIQSRAFAITDLFGQVRLDGGMDVQKFIFRPGKVFAHFLFGPGRQTALLSAKALRYDPLRQTWEKRLARYLSYQWRCKAHAGDYCQPFRVATLLEAVGDETDRRAPSRTKERLEKALETLCEDGIIRAWQYARWDEAFTGSRGWAPHWFQTTLLIEPPEVIADTYHHIEHHEAPKPKGLAPIPALGERLKHHRKALGLSQMQAAEQIGIDQGYLSRLERGKARYSADTQKRILHWLSRQVGLPAAMQEDHHT
jgi:hypothetical protein